MLGSLRLGGLLHLIADTVKMLLKEDIIPRRGNKALHTLAPMLMLFPALVLFAAIPFMDHWCADGAVMVIGHQDVCLSETSNYFSVADLDLGFLYIFAIASMGVYGVAIAGWASNSKLPLLGGLRASAQMVSYEVSMGLSVLGIVMFFGTLNLNEIVRGQGELLFGFLPAWGIFFQPLGFIIFLTAMIAENKRAPFNAPEGESEIATGYLVEYSSLKFGLMMISEFVAIGFVACIVAVLFLGGWQAPYLYADGIHMPTPVLYPIIMMALLGIAVAIFMSGKKRESRFLMGAGAFFLLNALAFLVLTFTNVNGFQALPYPVVVLTRIGAMVAKVVVLIWFQLMIRWTLPCFRYDQIMHLGWKVLLPAALVNLVVTALVLLPIFG